MTPNQAVKPFANFAPKKLTLDLPTMGVKNAESRPQAGQAAQRGIQDGGVVRTAGCSDQGRR